MSLREVPTSSWLTADEAAAYLKVEKRSLLRWVPQGKIRGYALARTTRHVRRFLHTDLDNALLAHPVPPSTSKSLSTLSGDLKGVEPGLSPLETRSAMASSEEKKETKQLYFCCAASCSCATCSA